LEEHYWSYAVSCENSKGAGERSGPGPSPELNPFDAGKCEKESARILRSFDKLLDVGAPLTAGIVLRFWFLVGGFSSKVVAEKALALPPPKDLDGGVHRRVMKRLQAVGQIGAPLGVILRGSDMHIAVDHAQQLALFSHLLSRMIEDDRSSAGVTPRSFLAKTAANPQVSLILQQHPKIRDALTDLGEGSLTVEAMDKAVSTSLGHLPAEVETWGKAGVVPPPGEVAVA